MRSTTQTRTTTPTCAKPIRRGTKSTSRAPRSCACWLTNTNVRTIMPRMPAAVRNPSAGTKGERTRAAILDVALRLVSKAGLDGLTIGTLADATGMSKSGLFAHFGSREELLLAVLAHGQAQFGEVVFQPAMAKPRGLPRLRAMFVNWLDWTESAELPGGCPMIGGATEFDDRPGPVREMLAGGQRTWI